MLMDDRDFIVPTPSPRFITLFTVWRLLCTSVYVCVVAVIVMTRLRLCVL